MDQDKLFVNGRYILELEKDIPKYINKNGVFKKIVNSPISKKIINDKDIWFALEDLPSDIQEKVLDNAVSSKDFIVKNYSKTISKSSVLNQEDVLVYVTSNTLLLPIVGNVLPSDGLNAYTVVNKRGHLMLKPIIVCWNCHWSELFAGQTVYENNVFCLASDLSMEQLNNYFDYIIKLKDVPSYLGVEDNLFKLREGRFNKIKVKKKEE